MNNLQEYVHKKLRGLRPDQLRQIAADVPEVSFPYLSKIARGKYESNSSYARLQAVADWFKKNRVAA